MDKSIPISMGVIRQGFDWAKKECTNPCQRTSWENVTSLGIVGHYTTANRGPDANDISIN